MKIKTKKRAVTATFIAPLYGRVREILDAARSNIARTVNTAQVIANWLIGREIVEDEQFGHVRAKYGSKLLVEISQRLKKEYGQS